jgi:hypothetical protein
VPESQLLIYKIFLHGVDLFVKSDQHMAVLNSPLRQSKSLRISQPVSELTSQERHVPITLTAESPVNMLMAILLLLFPAFLHCVFALISLYDNFLNVAS